MNLLSVDNLSVFFPIYGGIFRKKVGEVNAVSEVSFAIQEKTSLGIVGESGSGKSTLARAVIGLIPSQGNIFFRGKSLTQFSPPEWDDFRKQVQLIFQDPFASLNPRKSVGESLLEGVLYHQIVEKKEASEYVANLFEKVGLHSDHLSRYPHQFSGGQQQRICIARALSLKPKLIICDEAVSALDVSVQAQILNLLKELQTEFQLSYLFISHDLSVVRYFCDELIVMHQGKVVEKGNCESVFLSPQTDYTQRLLAGVFDPLA